MAGGATRYTQRKMLEHSLGKTAWTMPAATWLSLYTTAPTEDGGGTEANYGGYARLSINPASVWGVAGNRSPDGSEILNAVALIFNICTTGSNTIGGFGIMDAVSSGNMLWFGDTPNLQISAGITPRFEIGTLKLIMTATPP